MEFLVSAAVGFGTLLAILGMGAFLLPEQWRKLPHPWPGAIAAALGWLVSVNFVLFASGWVGLTVDKLLWGFWVPFGGVTLWTVFAGRFRSVFFPSPPIPESASRRWDSSAIL